MDLAARAPDPWPHSRDYEPNSALRTDSDFLSEDFCVLEGRYYFVRSLIKIPIQGTERSWGFGCWTTLSRANFDKYVDGFDEPSGSDETWTGWLCNQLEIYYKDPDPIGVWVHPQQNRQRPQLLVQDETHPLGRAQREGITPEALLTLLRAIGHGPTLQ